MAIENNLPIIFDTATQTEDGLMSYQDKIKLDNLDQNLNDKIGTTDLIKSSQLDISSDEVKIQPENLSESVINMITGQTAVSATIGNNTVTTEKIANNTVTIEKLDKTVILGNVVSPRPINFAFDTKKVTINFPKGTLLLIDAVVNRPIVTGVDANDVVVNLNYPEKYDGLNYIVSTTSGTLSLVNKEAGNAISSTSTVIALVSINKDTYEASIVMNGNYTINGLAQGVGTESAALMGTGKIVFDQQTGVIDFTKATSLSLIIGGVFNRTIESQASIELVDYSDSTIYNLYWDHATSSLKTSVAEISNTDTDVSKIALIKDGRIIPFVDTGIYYSKPYNSAPYYSESFDYIDNIVFSTKKTMNFLRKNECKLELFDEAYVSLNQQTLKVANEECYYEDREGMHYILFNLDTKEISCKYFNDPIDAAKNIVVGTFWVSGDSVVASGGFEYTVEGKAPYKDDLTTAEENIKELQDIIMTNLEGNKILAGNEIYMIEGEELPIYESSMMFKTVEGIKPAIKYNKNNNTMEPKTEFFDGNIELNKSIGDKISLLVYDKYNKHSYLKKDINILSVPENHKYTQSINILCIGDDLINDKTAYYVKNKLTSHGIVPEMLGTMVNSQVYGEGRDGWFYSTFVGASGRGIEEGVIHPQTSKGSSSILLNPFVRVANADDKANHPNDCYRAEGQYIEKNYYNDSDKNGAFYIFDFAKYLEVQGIIEPDVVVIAIKPELVNVFTEDIVGFNMIYMRQLVNGIIAALPNTHIAIIPQYGSCTVYEDMWEITHKMVDETIKYVNSLDNEKVRVLSSWLHMNREFGTEFVQSYDNSQLYENNINDITQNTLTESAKIELANSITAFIMNI